jgi:TRAP-type transport system periplasmic protein
MNRRTRLPALVGAAATVALLASGCTAPQEGSTESHTYTMAVYISVSAPHGEALDWMIKELEERTDGRIIIEPYYDGSLLPAAEILPGVADDLADFGFMTPLYHPAELPLSQVTSIPFATTDVRAVSAAVTNLYAENADYQREWEAQGVEVLNFVGVAPSMFAGKEPVTGLDYIAGKSIRSAGYGAIAIEAAGGTAVSIVIGELYESLERGLVDGYTNMLFDTMPSLSLQEVAPFVADTGLGTYGVNSIIANPAVWAGIAEEDQELIRELIGEFESRYFNNLVAAEDRACELVAEAGGSVVVWDEADTEEWKELVGDRPLEQWRSTVAATGADIDAFYETYLDGLSGSSDEPSGMARCAASQ